MTSCMAHDLVSPCEDCGVNTSPCLGSDDCSHAGEWEWYMVHDHVWAAAGMGEGFLCIECLEGRLGRPLTGADFPTGLPVNDLTWLPIGRSHRTARLVERIGAA